MGGTCSTHEDNYKLEGKKPLGRHGRIWEDNIKMDLREIVYKVVFQNWIQW